MFANFLVALCVCMLVQAQAKVYFKVRVPILSLQSFWKLRSSVLSGFSTPAISNLLQRPTISSYYPLAPNTTGKLQRQWMERQMDRAHFLEASWRDG